MTPRPLYDAHWTEPRDVHETLLCRFIRWKMDRIEEEHNRELRKVRMVEERQRAGRS